MIASANEISAPDDQIAVLKNTYDALLQLPPEGIAKWFNYQELYMDLANRDNLVLASLAINGYVSDDNFTDFRAWLVLQGRSVYLNALRYADSLADIDVAEGKAYCEEYGYVAMDAYSAKVFYIAAEKHLRGYLAQEETRAFVDAVVRGEALGVPQLVVPVPADPTLKRLRRYIKERFGRADVYKAAEQVPLTKQEREAVLVEIQFEKEINLPRRGPLIFAPQFTPRLCQKYYPMHQGKELQKTAKRNTPER